MSTAYTLNNHHIRTIANASLFYYLALILPSYYLTLDWFEYIAFQLDASILSFFLLLLLLLLLLISVDSRFNGFIQRNEFFVYRKQILNPFYFDNAIHRNGKRSTINNVIEKKEPTNCYGPFSLSATISSCVYISVPISLFKSISIHTSNHHGHSTTIKWLYFSCNAIKQIGFLSIRMTPSDDIKMTD